MSHLLTLCFLVFHLILGVFVENTAQRGGILGLAPTAIIIGVGA